MTAFFSGNRRRKTAGRVLSWLILTAIAGLAYAQSGFRGFRFTSENEFIRPEGYRRWIFAGSSLGLVYEGEEQADGSERFHNVYINPAAYDVYAKTGEFPAGTVLMLEIMTAREKTSILTGGRYEDQLVGLAAVVNAPDRFKEKWAYFSFNDPGKPFLEKAAANKPGECWTCHNQHGADDNVFVQFYPTLRDARGKGTVE